VIAKGVLGGLTHRKYRAVGLYTLLEVQKTVQNNKRAVFACFIGGVVMESGDVLHEVERLKALIAKKQG